MAVLTDKQRQWANDNPEKAKAFGIVDGKFVGVPVEVAPPPTPPPTPERTVAGEAGEFLKAGPRLVQDIVTNPIDATEGGARGIMQAFSPIEIEKVESALRVPFGAAEHGLRKIFTEPEGLQFEPDPIEGPFPPKKHGGGLIPEFETPDDPNVGGIAEGIFNRNLEALRGRRDEIDEDVPGVRVGFEAATLIGSFASLASKAKNFLELRQLPAARRVMLELEKALEISSAKFGTGELTDASRLKRIFSFIQDKRAKLAERKAKKKVRETIPKLSREREVIETVLRNPELVQEQINSGVVTNDVIVGETLDRLREVQKSLSEGIEIAKRAVPKRSPGKKIEPTIATKEPRNLLEQLRESNLGDPETKIKEIDTGRFGFNEKTGSVGPIIKSKEVEVPGKQFLDKGDLERINFIENKLTNEKVTSATAIKIIEKIDELLDMKNLQLKGKSGKISAGVDRVALDVRKYFNENIRVEFPELAKANDAFSSFMENARGAIENLDKTNPTSWIRRVLDPRNAIERKKLIIALNAAEESGVIQAERLSANFMESLRAMRAAVGIQDTTFGTEPVGKELSKHLFNKWMNTFQNTGKALGFGGLLLPGFFGAGAIGLPQYLGASVAGGLGAAIGGGIAKMFGPTAIRMLGLADPQKMLRAAMKAKRLSSGAREMASDLLKVREVFGHGADGTFIKMIQDNSQNTASASVIAELTRFFAEESPPEGQVDTSGVPFVPAAKENQ